MITHQHAITAMENIVARETWHKPDYGFGLCNWIREELVFLVYKGDIEKVEADDGIDKAWEYFSQTIRPMMEKWATANNPEVSTDGGCMEVYHDKGYYIYDPERDPSDNPRDQYNRIHNLWEGRQGEIRNELATYILDELKKIA